MLLHGDEVSRTQGGNNNAYCQDNEISWLDWEDAHQHWALLEFTEKVTRLRREHPVFQRRRFFHGRAVRGSGGLADIVWFTPAGTEMSDEDWEVGFARSVMVFLNGRAIPTSDSRGERVVDDSFLMLLNAADEDITFTLPDEEFGDSWHVVLDTAGPLAPDEEMPVKPGSDVDVESRSMLVLQRTF